MWIQDFLGLKFLIAKSYLDQPFEFPRNFWKSVETLLTDKSSETHRKSAMNLDNS